MGGGRPSLQPPHWTQSKYELIFSRDGFPNTKCHNAKQATWVSRNGADPLVRTKQGTHRSEWTWCAGLVGMELILW